MGALTLFLSLAAALLVGPLIIGIADRLGATDAPATDAGQDDGDHAHWRAAMGTDAIPDDTGRDYYEWVIEAHKAGLIDDAER